MPVFLPSTENTTALIVGAQVRGAYDNSLTAAGAKASAKEHIFYYE